MKIISIVENTSNRGLPVEHGLSLYIRLESGRNVLFDMGQGNLFAENASRLGLGIADVDTAIISHGHYDHGGGLGTFLSLNEIADVYIHEDAFLPHYSLREAGLRYIGIDKDLQANKRIIACGSLTHISDDMTLFADVQGTCCSPYGNKLLYEAQGGSRSQKLGSPCEEIENVTNDTFSHEQNLIIEEGDNVVLFAGCAHKGIINILRKAEEVIGRKPTHVMAGMHLVKSGLDEDAEASFIHTLANELAAYEQTKFYTMHCTGERQFLMLKETLGDQIEYLSCGDSIVIPAMITKGLKKKDEQ